MRSSQAIAAAVAALALACGGSSSGGGGNNPPPSGNVIQFGGSLGTTYSPSSLTVKVGDTVTWKGDFSAHPLASGATCGQPDGKFGATSGSTYSFTFTTAGTYPYYCAVHCTIGMKGTITVQ
jgi:plastocyanin